METLDEAIKKDLDFWHKGRKNQLEMLLSEIDTYNYSTFAQLKGAIHTHLELIEDRE